MALDGVTIAGIVWEIKKNIINSRLDKISQPEKEEVILSFRNNGRTYRLLLSANPGQPRVHFTEQSRSNPAQAPLFCMVLRKHLQGGRLINITQPDFERIIQMHFETTNELGDPAIKTLTVELMGRHSNIMLVDHQHRILDSIRHITHEQSSVRQVLPGCPYTAPPSKNKRSPLTDDREWFDSLIVEKANSRIHALLYQSYNGISPLQASEICHRADIDPDTPVNELSEKAIHRIYLDFRSMVGQIRSGDFRCAIFYNEQHKPFEYACLPYSMFDHFEQKSFEGPSAMLETFYGEKESVYRLSQKTADLRKHLGQLLERCVRKKQMHLKTLQDIQHRDTNKIYGELLTAWIHSIQPGTTSFSCENYYEEDSPLIQIPLDPQLTPTENAQRYFKKYNKDKRTFEALQQQMLQNEEEIQYLESILIALDQVRHIQDIEEIRQELYQEGVIRKQKKSGHAGSGASKPWHYRTEDDFDIYVGRNNLQNDRLTKGASAGDIWMHTKGIPGSHVIIRTENRPVSNSALETAAMLAAWYSRGRQSGQVPVDYTQKKNVKKPNGSRPGFVIYETNKTIYVTPDEKKIQQIMLIES